MDILNEDERGREAHQISFTARMVETMRILNGITENTGFSTGDPHRLRYKSRLRDYYRNP